MDSSSKLDAYWFHEREWDDFDHLRREFTWEIPDRFNIAEYVCDRWMDDDERVALLAEDEAGTEREYSFRELGQAANRLANVLSNRGIQRGDVVGICAPPKPETAISHIAIWKIGAVSVPLSTLFGADALQYRLNDCQAKGCIVDEANLESLRRVRDSLGALDTVLTIGDVTKTAGERDFWQAVEGASPEFETVSTNAEDDAIIIYTSGTTGDPKGVLQAHRFFLGHLPVFITTFCNLELRPEDVFWSPSEWAWVATLFDILFPALFYGKTVLAYDGGPFDPENTFELIEKYGVTNFLAPPSALRQMMNVSSSGEVYEPNRLRVLTSGGLDPNIVTWVRETFGTPVVHEAYGQTEANIIAGQCSALMESPEGCMGKPGPGHEMRIVDPETSEPDVAPGDVGEIALKYDGDPVAFKEYWNAPEKTAQKVQNGWLLTEDLGWADKNGHLYFKSRKDDVILSSGYKIGPEEVEQSLAEHDAVAEVGVIGVPDDQRGQIAKAFVELAPSYNPSRELKEELKQHVKLNLAKYEYPREIEIVESLPMTRTGKVKRIDLRDREGLSKD